MSGGSKKKVKKRSPVCELSDDLLVEIISRVPYKSTRCCKCVCTRWRDLVSHPDYRKNLPRSSLAGFFYRNKNRSGEESRCYKSLTGPHIDTSLSFLLADNGADLLDSCNGLLLCRRSKKVPDYMVCNPATLAWEVVPTIEWPNEMLDARLGFDSTISSSHYHAFEFVHASMWKTDKGHRSSCIKSVRIYSSQANVWTRQSAWDQPIAFLNNSRSAFLKGVLYFPSDRYSVIAAVDVEGNCRVIRYPKPHIGSADVYLSRGQLYLANYGGSELSIWALEDSIGENWILKHNVSHLQILGDKYRPSFPSHFTTIIHPEHNVLSIVCPKAYYYGQSSDMKLVSYNMDSREMHFVCNLPRGCTSPYLPYLLLF